MSWAERVRHRKKHVSVSPNLCKEEIVKLSCSVKAIIQDIWACKGPLGALSDLNKAARTQISLLKSKIRELEDISNEVDNERLRMDLKQLVENQTRQLQYTQATLRKANLSCKLSIDNREKDALLGSREIRAQEIRHRQENSNKSLAQTGSEITENLLSITRMMDNTVKQSSATLQTLVTSSKSISDTNEELKDQSGLIHTGHRLLTKYNRREFTDKILIFLAMALFFATVLYILKRRLF
ncbi:vesicle transport protein SEC20-like [Clavelina lepadiformis]|uniref:Sec20 C-terminal domain-containing protein n=1 Tax=Clavelina lepadiformis TaxID=159417 RepID=A0ABP0EVG1_CLALP